MIKFAASLSILAAATLAACSSYQAPPSSSDRSQIVTRNIPYMPGTGVVQSVTPVPDSAATGGSAAASIPASGDVRLGIRMDNDRMQYVDTDSRDFPVGTRVRLTEDRVIMRQ